MPPPSGPLPPGDPSGVPVEVPLGGRDPDLVADELFALGASAVLERDDTVVADLPPDALDRVGPHRVLEDTGPATAEVRARDVGRRLRLVPAGRPSGSVPQTRGITPGSAEQNGGGGQNGGGRVEVVLEAGGAFGSGSHPSTRLCLAALEPLAPSAASVLDVGCGTGVLGVASLLLGAGSLTAVDVDPEAVRVTRRVLARNGVEDRAQVRHGEVAGVDGRVELVLANLLVSVLESLGGELVDRVAPGGALVVGGVLVEQRCRALAALEPLVARVAHVEGDWWTAVLTHPSPSDPGDG